MIILQDIFPQGHQLPASYKTELNTVVMKYSHLFEQKFSFFDNFSLAQGCVGTCVWRGTAGGRPCSVWIRVVYSVGSMKASLCVGFFSFSFFLLYLLLSFFWVVTQ